MHNQPIIKFELEGLKNTVMQYMGAHHDEVNEMVKHQLETTLTEDWVKFEIEAAVHETVKEAIKSIGSKWQVRSAVEDALEETISGMIRDNSKGEQ